MFPLLMMLVTTEHSEEHIQSKRSFCLTSLVWWTTYSATHCSSRPSRTPWQLSPRSSPPLDWPHQSTATQHRLPAALAQHRSVLQARPLCLHCTQPLPHLFLRPHQRWPSVTSNHRLTNDLSLYSFLNKTRTSHGRPPALPLHPPASTFAVTDIRREARRGGVLRGAALALRSRS